MINVVVKNQYQSRADKALIGSMGILHSNGQVKVKGVYWNVHFTTLPIGSIVKVISRKGMTLKVESVKYPNLID